MCKHSLGAADVSALKSAHKSEPQFRSRKRVARSRGARSGGLGRSMRKFGNYPIRINYNLHTQLRSRPHEIQFHEAKQYQAERQLSIKTNTSSDAALENGMYKPEIEKYEKDVYDCLVGIHHNPVGRMVLGLINRSTTVWIIPRSAGDMKQCNCA